MAPSKTIKAIKKPTYKKGIYEYASTRLYYSNKKTSMTLNEVKKFYEKARKQYESNGYHAFITVKGITDFVRDDGQLDYRTLCSFDDDEITYGDEYQDGRAKANEYDPTKERFKHIDIVVKFRPMNDEDDEED